MKKVILTKKRLRRLDEAITLDDVMYEKYRRMMDAVDEKYHTYLRAKNIVRVLKSNYKTGVTEEMTILKLEISLQGTVVIVKD